MNSREKVLRHNKTRNAGVFGPPTGHEVIIRGLPDGWVPMSGDVALGGTRDGADWKHSAAGDDPINIRVVNEEMKLSRSFIANPPVAVEFVTILPDEGTPATPATPATPPSSSSTTGTVQFSSASAWAAGKRLIATLSSTVSQKPTIGTDGTAVLTLPIGRWDINVEGDDVHQVIDVVAGGTYPLVMATPASRRPVESAQANLVVIGVGAGDSVRSSPSVPFTRSNTPETYTATVSGALLNQRMHITLVRANGQNETRTITPAGGTIEVRFAPTAKHADKTNYFLWGAGAIAALAAAYAITAPKQP